MQHVATLEEKGTSSSPGSSTDTLPAKTSRREDVPLAVWVSMYICVHVFMHSLQSEGTSCVQAWVYTYKSPFLQRENKKGT